MSQPDMAVVLRRLKTVQRELYSDYQHCHREGFGIVSHPAAFMRWYELLGKVITELEPQETTDDAA
jgi:hypothetical protein